MRDHRVLNHLNKDNYGLALEIASLPKEIRGYGHVKEQNLQKCEEKLGQLKSRFSAIKSVRAAA